MPAPRPPDPPPVDDLDHDGLPPPPVAGPRLPAWVGDLRARLGLDHRAVAWVAVAVVAAAAAAWLLRPAPAPVEEALPMAASEPSGGAGGPSPASGPAPAPASGAPAAGASPSSTTEPEEVVVHAAGAVVHPGVYPLPGGARVDDLVRAAGGLAANADGARLNLAAPLTDGARVYVPHVGEGEPPAVVGADGGAPEPGGGAGAPSPAGGDGAGGTPGADAPAAPVDLNTATEDELDALPGVGPTIAAAIVAFRTENGGFASVDDLLDVKGIGEARLAELRPLVTV